MSLPNGARLGPYEVTGRIGAGGMRALLSVSTGRETPIDLSRATGTALHSGSVVLDHPSWSPDGSRLFFDVTRNTGDIDLLGGD